MTLPRAVQEAAARVDASYENTVTPAPVEEPQPQPEIPEPQPKAEVKASEDKPDFEKLDKPLGEVKDPWEKKYELLQGKYNAEVPRLYKEIKALKANQQPQNNAEVEALKQTVQQLQSQLESKPQPEPVTTVDLGSLTSEYPEDLVKGLAGVYEPQIKQLNDLVGSLQAQLKQVETTSSQTSQRIETNQRQERLERLLKDQGVNFAQQNNDPLFMDWLKDVEPYTGKSRSELMNEAYQSGDIERTAKFFTDYAESHQPQSVQSPPTPDLSDQVPVKPSTAQVEKTPTQPVWSPDSITQLYAARRQGKISEEEFKRLENQLYATPG